MKIDRQEEFEKAAQELEDGHQSERRKIKERFEQQMEQHQDDTRKQHQLID